MKVLLDASGLQNQYTGMCNYILHVVDALCRGFPEHEYTVILNPVYEGAGAFPEEVRVFDRRIEHIGPRREFKYLALRDAIVREWDVFHCLTEKWPLSMSQGVCTIHDLRCFRTNMFGGLSIGKSMYFRLALRRALAAADKVVTVSRSTRDDIVKYLGERFSEKLVVVNSGFDSAPKEQSDWGSVSRALGVRAPYLLCVGEIRQHKNHVGLISAFQEYAREYSEDALQLVIAGRVSDERLRARLAAGDSRNVVFTGYVSDGDLRALYAEASLFVLLSHVEGFGFPVLEAMSCGLPVLCSNSTSLREVAGNAAIQVDPSDHHVVAKGIRRALTNKTVRDELIEEGYNVVKRYTWEATAKNLMAIYESIFR